MSASEDTVRIPAPIRDANDPVIRALTDLKLTIIRSDLSSAAAAVLIRETNWPEGTVEYRRALLRMGHMLGAWHDENRTAIEQVDRLIARVVARR